jgi:hypothetical protein
LVDGVKFPIEVVGKKENKGKLVGGVNVMQGG